MPRLGDRNCERDCGDDAVARTLHGLAAACAPQDAAALCDMLRVLACEFSRESSSFHEAVKVCLRSMCLFSSESMVQRSGLLVLAALCEKQRLASSIGLAGGVQVMLQIWDRFPDDENLAKTLIVTMRSLSEDESNRATFGELGGARRLVKSMQRFPERASIQTAACVVLANLCYENESRRRYVVEAGAVESTVGALIHFDTEDQHRLQTNACFALCNVSMSTWGSERMFECKQCVPSVLKILVHARPHPCAVEEALSLLVNLCTTRKLSVPIASCSENIADHVVLFLEKTMLFPTRFSVSHVLCYTTIGGIVTYAREGLTRERCKRLCQVGLLYIREYVSKQAPHSVSIVSHICRCLRVLLYDCVNRQYLCRSNGGISLLVECITFLQDRPLHVEHALLALGNAIFDCPVAKSDAGSSGVISIVKTVIQKHALISSVAEACLMTLHALCSQNDVNGETATTLLLHCECVRLMREFSEDPSIQEKALAALISFGTSADALRELRNILTQTVVRNAAAAFPYSRNILAHEAKIEQLVSVEASGRQSTFVKLMQRTKSLPLSIWKPFSRE